MPLFYEDDRETISTIIAVGAFKSGEEEVKAFMRKILRKIASWNVFGLDYNCIADLGYESRNRGGSMQTADIAKAQLTFQVSIWSTQLDGHLMREEDLKAAFGCLIERTTGWRSNSSMIPSSSSGFRE